MRPPAVLRNSACLHNHLLSSYCQSIDLDKVLTFDHRGVGIEPVDKTLALVIDPAVALSGYFKLNSNLNHCTPEVFKDLAARANRNTISQANDSTKVLSADCLYQPTLDPQFYHDMIQWFGLSDCYELANHVHALWFQAHERAQQEFVSYTNNLYRKDQL